MKQNRIEFKLNFVHYNKDEQCTDTEITLILCPANAKL